MNTTRLISVFAENKPGQTALITKLLADAGVNIFWVTIANNGTFGVMKFLVDQRDLALQTLRENGLMVTLMDFLAVETGNRPGALHDVAALLSRKAINLDNCSGFVVGDRAVLVIETHELARARTLLEEADYRLLTQQEMMDL